MKKACGAVFISFLLSLNLSAQSINQSDSAKIMALLDKSMEQWAHSLNDAVATAQQALRIAQSTNNLYLQARSWERLGGLRNDQADYDKALECHLNALRLWEKLGRQNKIAKAYREIGYNYEFRKDYVKAEEYYTRALAIAERANVTSEIIMGLMSLGIIADLKDEPAKSIGLYGRAMKIAESNQFLPELNALRVNAGMSYKRLKDYPKALEMYGLAQTYFKLQGDSLYTAQLDDNIGVVYTLMGKYEEAEKSLIHSLKGLQKAGARDIVADVYLDLSKMFEARDNYAKALEWYKKKVTLRDSLINETKNKQIAEAQEKYQSEKKEQTIALQNAKIRHDQWVQNMILVACLFIIVVAGILFWNFKKIQKLNLQLAELNSVKDKLFSAISHDLRSPLGQITNMLYMMQRGRMTEEKLKERTTEFLGAMQQTMQMLDNLLYWATSQMKGLSLNKSNVVIKELVDENMELMQPEAAVKKIEMLKKIEETAIVVADINMTRLVLRNLISNAIKFTPENGRIIISAGAVSGGIRIEVADTGVGISPQTIEALHSNKQVNSRSGTNAEKGFGIGLQLCKDFIEQNGGKLEVSSEPGKGSTFSFILPVS